MSGHDDDTVGYGNPPREHQFQKGQSGNPRGRPRKPKMERAMNTRQGRRDFFEVTEQALMVGRPGKRRRMPAIKVVINKMLEQALQGHPPSQRYLVNRHLELLAAHEDANPRMADMLETYELILVDSGPGTKAGQRESLNILREISRRL